MATPEKSKLERARELDIDARREYDKQNHVFAAELARTAHHLRMQYQQEQIAKGKSP